MAPLTLEQEELRGLSRTVAEIEWLLLALVLLYHLFSEGNYESRPALAMALFFYAAAIMGFRYTHVFRQETRWKLAVETWIMTAFITWSLRYTGGLESPLLNCYLMVIITSALALDKLTTLLELCLVAACFVLLGDPGLSHGAVTPGYVGGMFAKFAPFVLVAYITTLFSADIRYGLTRIQQMAETDELTGVLNRRGFAAIADRLLAQAQRYRRPLSVLMIDSDNLKQINDHYGHEAGDHLLKDLVRNTLTQLRSTDVLARLGGDEFAVLLPETPAAGAQDVAQRILHAVADNPLVLGSQQIPTTVSIGIAVYPEQGGNLDTLLANADRHLYRAKQSGRNTMAQ
ncbi:MAG: GGDEF domain-containing protein [Proteobacteria bacterium]|nr:GGDEF domain-containing protein [Pseudomonadota bacterium]HQR03812.1 GGDEF domain-containing protein [Rhodocyclaceae bacterium]